jgi:hypothetical protein
VIPRDIEILCSECFLDYHLLSSISFASQSRLKRIACGVCNRSFTVSVTLPPAISFIDSGAFSTNCEIYVSECDSCVELARWSATHFHSDSHSAVDFRRTLCIGSELPIFADSLVDLLQFEAVRALGVCEQGDGLSHLYRRG